MAEGQRGRLRIYLGAAPGVGKTYAMLNEGRRRAERGTDVVVGYVEHHQRPRTLEQLAGLEIVPRRVIVHRDRPFEELDLPAVLARRPQVALVDELAHTNVPGAGNEKRWQDVEALLDAGIDVISTVNVQHLESLNDVVERITGIAQQETVPDAVVRAAEQVELVDMTPEALRRRMAHGNIYGPDKVDDALGNYFRVGNLTALRELALMWLADKVDQALTDYQDAHGIHRTWEARERVVVAITGAPSGEHLVRRAARLAGRVGGELVGVHIRMGDGLRAAPSKGLERQRTLLGDLGGQYHEVIGEDIATALVAFARAEHATQIVLGATERTRWRELWSGSVINRVARASGDMDVHVISRADMPEETRRPTRHRAPVRSPISARRRLIGWAMVLVAVPLLTAALVLVRESFGLPGDLMLYVLLIVGISAVGGAGPGITGAIACGLLGNWFLTEPYHTFTIAEPENTIALLVFVGVASAVSILVARTERRAIEAATASAEAEALARVAAGVALDEDPLPALLDRVRTTFGLEGAVLFVRDGAGWQRDQVSGGDPDVRHPDQVDLAVPAGDDAVLGLVGPPPTASDQRVLRAFADQLAIVLEQRRLREEASQAEVIAEGDALRTALLRAVSHDLRTPLASIKASVSSLQADDVTWSTADREDFLATIDEETDRLDHLVGNLLDMSRLQTGVLQMATRPIGWEEVVAAASASLPTGATAQLLVDVPETLPPVTADPALLERSIANVVANALAHAGGRPVELTARASGDEVTLSVIDHGPGVPADQRARLFEPFQRLGDTGGGGVGLGLAVAHGFVAAMGGRIDPVDTPGGGLTMRIALRAAT
jgi:two-component system sensor histidine kinase KdpD